MATRPSDEEILQAVERQLAARRRINTRLTDPGAASLVWESVLECEIHRSILKRDVGPRKAKGPLSRNRHIVERVTCADLEAYVVEPPADPAQRQVVHLVQEGTLDEVPCGDCEGGTQSCGTCDGRGRVDCPAWIVCEVCRGGPDTCWECDGTGTPRTRRARGGTRPRREGTRERAAECKRCHAADVACPKCSGDWRWECPACDGKGHLRCGTCNGDKRVRHKGCDATGRLTVWTGATITHEPHHDELPVKRYSGRLRSGDWHREILTSPHEDLPDFLEDGHAKRLAPLLQKREGEVRRRVHIRLLPFARVETPADPDHVYHAFPLLSGGIEVIDRFSRQRKAALLWAAAAVVALAVTITLTVLR
ncbi:hypothetical protein ABZ464_17515 [Streptomyces sp. NPDC005820]|uniref:hypothetical protein n=1 Tax=Streptomyces sp. NPDC005820 TaxID=3157069 RepID=UPI0033FB0A63